MIVVGEGGVQEGVDDHQSQALAHDPRPHGEDVGVVMLPRGFGGEAVPAEGAADAADLVGRDGDADAGAADEDAALAFARGNGLRDRLAVDGIVAGGVRVGPEILIGKAPLLEVGDDRLLESVAAVIAADGNHSSILRTERLETK